MIDLSREKPLSVADAARHMRVAHKTIYKWFDRGLESMKLGGKRITTLEALQRFGTPDFKAQPTYDPHEDLIRDNTRKALAALAEL